MNRNLSKIQVANLIDEASQLNNEIKKIDAISSTIINVVGKFSAKSSEFLAGTVGACIGLSGGYGISLLGTSIVFSPPVGMILGVAFSVLLWRGIGQHKIERLNKKDYIAKEKLLNEIKSLPTDAPQYIKDNLWKTYDNMTEIYQQKAIESLLDNSSKTDVIHEQEKKNGS